MSCSAAGGTTADMAVAEKFRRAALEKMQREKLTEIQRTLDELHDKPFVQKSELDRLSIAYGPMLDVDNWSSVATPNEYQSRFFVPFDWPQDWLEYQAWSVSDEWTKMDHHDLYSVSSLHFQWHRSRWFRESLCNLYKVDPNVWDVYCRRSYLEIVNAISLHLRCREFRSRARPGAYPFYEYSGEGAYLAKAGSDRPRAICLMLDSGGKSDQHQLLRSEVEAALCMSSHQLRDGLFADRHTKPVLIATILREQTARLTQAHFDAKYNKLILRQSRLLDLSGSDPGDDTWLLLRWMASTAVGQTEYQENAQWTALQLDDNSPLAPPIAVADLP